MEADAGEAKAQALWEAICARVNLAPPQTKLPACFQDAGTHFEVRAALVMEEARHAISSPLSKKWKRNGKAPSGTMTLAAHYDEKFRSNAHAKIVFIKHTPFTKEELFNVRPGAVFECLPRDGQRSIHNVIIGVVGSGNRETVEKNRSFTMFVFRDIPTKIEQTEWILAPLATLVTELRQFEAMTCRPTSISFLNTLLGNKDRTHIRFGDLNGADSAGAAQRVESKDDDDGAGIRDYFRPVDEQEAPPAFRLPKLNPSQEKAAFAFLESPKSAITIVQGPPGTGAPYYTLSID